MMIRRKFIWLIVLMVWVGMVTSIIVYQGEGYLGIEQATSDDVKFVEEQSTTAQKEINFTQSKEETESEKNFFIEYRLDRDKSRSKQIDIYREVINNPNTDEAAKKEAQRKMLALTDKMEKEMEIESLIRARGYKDALAYIHDKSVDVIIQTEGLLQEDVAKIGDIIVKTTGFDFDDVTIIEKKLNK